jgi:hypothetical protein
LTLSGASLPALKEAGLGAAERVNKKLIDDYAKINANQRYLKFPRPVILNHALNLFHGWFQDLTHWTNRDAEPILSQAQHKVQLDNNGFLRC